MELGKHRLDMNWIIVSEEGGGRGKRGEGERNIVKRIKWIVKKNKIHPHQ